jgi:DNA polymerase-1
MAILLLIDANSLLHRFFHALPPLTAPDGTPTGALYGLAGMLLKILKEKKANYIAAAFDTPEETFREKSFKEYKIHRPPAAAELVYQLKTAPEIFDLYKIKTFAAPGFEADDIIGTLAEKFKSNPDLKIVILSGDNDVLQLVEGKKIVAEIVKTGISETTIYDETAVLKKYNLKPKNLPDYKAFLGDASDNIPGVAGIGPKTALKLLNDFGTAENVFKNLTIIDEKIRKKLAGQFETALLSKKLATICKNVPLKIDNLEELKIEPLDKEALQKYFEKMGFKSLVTRINK